MKYKVLRITNDVAEYPECKDDTEAYPDLVDHVEDEMDLFVMADDGQFWEAGEFFAMAGLTEFESGEVT